MARRVKNSDMFFIYYQDGDTFIDLWNFKKGQEGEFAAFLLVYFSKLKAAQIVESSISSKNNLDGDIETMMNVFIDLEKQINQNREDLEYEELELGSEPPVISPDNMYRAQVIPVKREA